MLLLVLLLSPTGSWSLRVMKSPSDENHEKNSDPALSLKLTSPPSTGPRYEGDSKHAHAGPPGHKDVRGLFHADIPPKPQWDLDADGLADPESRNGHVKVQDEEIFFNEKRYGENPEVAILGDGSGKTRGYSTDSSSIAGDSLFRPDGAVVKNNIETSSAERRGGRVDVRAERPADVWDRTHKEVFPVRSEKRFQIEEIEQIRKATSGGRGGTATSSSKGNKEVASVWSLGAFGELGTTGANFSMDDDALQREEPVVLVPRNTTSALVEQQERSPVVLERADETEEEELLLVQRREKSREAVEQEDLATSRDSSSSRDETRSTDAGAAYELVDLDEIEQALDQADSEKNNTNIAAPKQEPAKTSPAVCLGERERVMRSYVQRQHHVQLHYSSRRARTNPSCRSS